MIDDIIVSLQKQLEVLRQRCNIQKLYRYYKNKKYLAIFFRQYRGLLSNLKSISVLLNNGCIEDAFTIFRKYLETYFIIFSLYEHPEVVESYVLHNDYIAKKACGKDIQEVKTFYYAKPEGFLEYGYLEEFANSDEYFKYTTKFVAEVGGVKHFHYLYKMACNFVHNNLTAVSINLEDATKNLNLAITNTVDYLLTKFNFIIE